MSSEASNEQLSIIEILRLLLSKWRLVLAFTICGVCLAVVAIIRSNTVYEGNIILEVRNASEVMREILPSRDIVIQRLKEEYDVARRLEPTLHDPKLVSVVLINGEDQKTADGSTAYHLNLTAHGLSIDETSKFLTSIVTKLIEETNSAASQGRELHEELMKNSDQAIAKVKADYDTLTKTYDSLSSEQGIADRSIVAIQKYNASQLLSKLQAKRFQNKLDEVSLSKDLVRVTKGPQFIPGANPVRPRPLAWIVFGAIIGLFSGITTALCSFVVKAL